MIPVLTLLAIILATVCGGFLADSYRRTKKERRLRNQVLDLEKANTELERFAFHASHDLKEPLRMISTYLGLLARDYGAKMTDEQSTYLNYALDGSKRLNGLVDSLLQFSRIGSKSLEREEIPLSDVVEEVVDSLQSSIKETRAKVEKGHLPCIVGDRVQIGQVFQNLITNAIKFRKPDEDTVIRITSEARGKESVITVTDNGLGIEPADQVKIFEIFQRLHRRSDYPGEGIGLAACKKIIDTHGGRIWVTSQKGNGSSFHFILPTCRAKSVVAAKASGSRA